MHRLPVRRRTSEAVIVVTVDFALQRCGLCAAAVWSLHYSTVGFALQHLGLHFMLLLDGLDEVEISARSACIEAINTYQEEHLTSLVVCSRTRDYENQQIRLILPLAVEIQPLTLQHISAYLKQAGKSLAAVRTTLRTNVTLQRLITTPLLLMAVLLTYRDKLVKDLPQLGSAEDQQQQIFAHYIQRMLERHQEHRTISSHQLTHSLIWLAQIMQERHQTEWYLEWLQPNWFLTKRAQTNYWLLISLLTGLTGMLVGGLTGGLLGGVIFGLTGMLNSKRGNIQLIETFNWSWNKSRVGLLIGLFVGLLIGLFVGLLGGILGRILGGLTGALFGGLPGGLTGGLLGGLIGGLSGTSLHANVRLRPNQGIHTSGRNAFRIGSAVLLICGLFAGLSIGLSAGMIAGLFFGLFFGLLMGLFFGLFFGLIAGLLFGGNAYLRHYLLRFFLAQSGIFPWNAIPLLEEATVCILLQRVGGGYRFIHPLLQEYFASLTTYPIIL